MGAMNRPPKFDDGIMARGERKPHRERSLAELSVTVWLTPEDCRFTIKNGLLWFSHDGKEERVTLCRDFPFDLCWEYISVLDENMEELGIIRDISVFSEEQQEVIRTELSRRYYAPQILSVESVKERFGFSHWKVKTQDGDAKFTMHDTFRNLIRISEKRVILLDVDGNRYEIPDLSELDAKSFRKMELYL